MDKRYDEVSAGAVIFRRTPEGRRYLLLQYGWGHWDFPKGHMEPGETELETVRRELREETGITEITLVDGFREIIEYSYHRRRDLSTPAVTKVVYFYLAETRAGDVVLSHEHKNFAWLSIEEAIARTTYQNSRDLLQKADKLIGSAAAA